MASTPFDVFACDLAPLFDIVCDSLSADAIDGIASCDYGYEYAENLSALRSIVSQRRPPSPLAWPPLEVLELTRWSAAYVPEAERSAAQIFCAAALLWASCDPVNCGMTFVESANENLAVLMVNILHVTHEWLPLTVQFIAAFGRSRDALWPHDAQPAFAAFGLLLLLADERSPRQPLSTWQSLVAFVFVEDRQLRQPAEEASTFVVDEELVLGLTGFDQRHEWFRRLTHAALASPAGHIPPEVRDDLRRIAASIRPPS